MGQLLLCASLHRNGDLCCFMTQNLFRLGDAHTGPAVLLRVLRCGLVRIGLRLVIHKAVLVLKVTVDFEICVHQVVAKEIVLVLDDVLLIVVNFSHRQASKDFCKRLAALLQFLKKFLRMASSLGGSAGFYVFFDRLPVALVHFECLQKSQFLLLRPSAIVFEFCLLV
jgi:hypothetical protein